MSVNQVYYTNYSQCLWLHKLSVLYIIKYYKNQLILKKEKKKIPLFAFQILYHLPSSKVRGL